MKSNKKYLGMLVAAGMILSLAACGKGNDTKPTETNQTAEQKSSQATDNTKGNDSEKGTDKSGDQLIVPAKLTAKLNLIELEDRDPSILRAIKISGNCVGTAEGFNSKKASLDDVRCIFELNEWVEFYPDIDKEYGLRVWILEHRDDHEYYKTCKFTDLMPGFAGYCDLHYPVDEDKPDEYNWGSTYLNPDEHEPGYYDFVFTYDGKAIATLVTRFYSDDGKLETLSDTELEALMHE